ncbi:MAG: 1-phosphofructokinase [Planctomycetaceae bacterium]|nr:1-phosphofructokinase [Planctomycetaceae bacterium]
MRIVTVTLNPALDKTAVLDTLQPGELNRLRDVTVDAGGKGVNVSKMIAALGGESIASGFVGGGSGDEIAKTLSSLGINHDFLRIASPTRTNLKVVDQGSRLTELNEPGPAVTSDEVEALRHKLQTYAGADSLFVFSGSLPSGVGKDIYRDLITLVRDAGATAFLDADGDAFAQAVDAGPSFIKPNRFELLQYFDAGKSADTHTLVRLCRKLLEKGIGRIALSMGKEGALFVSGDDVFACPGLEVEAQSSVGAGDSMVGAVAYGTVNNLSWRDTAALAMASSAGAVTTVGTKPPCREVVDALLRQVRFVDVG